MRLSPAGEDGAASSAGVREGPSSGCAVGLFPGPGAPAEVLSRAVDGVAAQPIVELICRPFETVLRR